VSEPSLLLVVEEAHPARGGDVVLAPRIVVHGPAGPPFAVSLELPDGSQRAAAAALDVAHIRGPNGAFALVRLVGLTVDDVPTGTRVFRIASPS
jgi:hypothetical protein